MMRYGRGGDEIFPRVQLLKLKKNTGWERRHYFREE